MKNGFKQNGGKKMHQIQYITIFFLFTISLSSIGAEKTKFVTENQLKAVLIFNFARYSYLPDRVFETVDTAYNICLVKELLALNEVSKNETIHNRPINVINLTYQAQLPYCHILFIDSHNEKFSYDLLRYVQAYPIVTIGNGLAFTKMGGMVSFIKKSNSKMGFSVNVEAASFADIKISANLLQLATIVYEVDKSLISKLMAQPDTLAGFFTERANAKIILASTMKSTSTPPQDEQHVAITTQVAEGATQHLIAPTSKLCSPRNTQACQKMPVLAREEQISNEEEIILSKLMIYALRVLGIVLSLILIFNLILMAIGLRSYFLRKTVGVELNK